MKSFKIFLCIAIIASVFSGCMSNQRLSELTLVQGVGIDLQDEKTCINLQYLNLEKGSLNSDSLSGNITTVANGSANSISDAVSTASKSLSKKIFFGQNKIIVFGFDYAKEKIDDGLDYLLRSVDSRPDVIVALSDDDAKSIIENKERDSKIPAKTVYDLLNIGEKNGLGAVVTVADLLNMYCDDTSDIFLPVLKSDDDSVSCLGIALFSNSNYVDTLSEFKTFGFLFVNNKIEGGTIDIKNDQMGEIAVEILKSSTKNSVTVKNGQITFSSKIKVKLVLNEMKQGISTAIDDKKIEEIEKMAENTISKMCKNAVNFCISNGSDPFMIGKYLAKANNSVYQSVKDNWKQTVKQVNYTVDVDAQLERVNDNSVRD